MDLDLGLILLAALLTTGSPGPATLAIAGVSMARGRRAGLGLASGITLGSWTWSAAAALGIGATMLAHAWLIEALRWMGAGYLTYLALRAARSALSPDTPVVAAMGGSRRALFMKGLALHLTNPKAIFFFGALYSLGMPPGAGFEELATVTIAVGVQSLVVFHGYAVLFSSRPATAFYLKTRRWMEGAFAIGFAAAGVKLLTTRMQ